MCRSNLLTFLILMPLFIVWSCADMKSPLPRKVMEAKPAPPVKEHKRTSIETSAQAAHLAKNKMDAGEYQKAIGIYDVTCQSHPHDQSLLKEYAQSIEKIKAIADEAFSRENFLSAARCYAILIKNYPSFGGSGIKPPFSLACIDEKFSISKKMISRQGFEEYRKGNLNHAIALWQALIDIDHNNPDIIRALNTARVQQNNLQK